MMTEGKSYPMENTGKKNPVKKDTFEERMKKIQRMKSYLYCGGFIYHEAEGWPDEGIAAGTRWKDIPDDWKCPDCGTMKKMFEIVEI